MGVKNSNPGVHLGYFRLRKRSTHYILYYQSEKTTNNTMEDQSTAADSTATVAAADHSQRIAEIRAATIGL